MVDKKTKKQVMERVKARKFFTTKMVAKELNIEPRLIGRLFIEMSEDGLIKRWSKRQWTWV